MEAHETFTAAIGMGYMPGARFVNPLIADALLGRAGAALALGSAVHVDPIKTRVET
jgi:hypothetical protein